MGRLLSRSDVRGICRVLAAHRMRIVAVFLLSVLEAALATVGLVMIIPIIGLGLESEGSAGHVHRWMMHLASWFPEDHRVGYLMVVLVSLLVLKTVVSISSRYLAIDFGLKMAEESTVRLHSQYMGRTYEQVLRIPQGEAIYQISQEPAIASKFWIGLVEYAGRVVVSMVLVLALLAIDWQATLGLGITALILWFVAHRILGGVSKKLGEQRIEVQEDLARRITEDVSMILPIRAFGILRGRAEAVTRSARHKRHVIRRYQLFNLVPGNVNELMALCLLAAAVFFMTGFEPDRVHGRIAEIAALVLIAREILSNVSVLLANGMSLAFRIPSVRAVYCEEFSEQNKKPPALLESKSRPHEIKSFEGHIVFDAIRFEYADGSRVFDGFDATIQKGKLNALIGPSGMGKTTLMHLLMGLLEPTEGNILVDGKPLSSCQLSSWLSCVGYVPQDPALFHGSIRDNIAMGLADASDAQIQTAAERAGASAFIESLPDGHDTVVGDRGATLSGGQRQRIAIARCLVREPSLILFDEATSALDDETEIQIRRTMDRLRHDTKTTLLVIAHRARTIQDADHVIDLGVQRGVVNGNTADS